MNQKQIEQNAKACAEMASLIVSKVNRLTFHPNEILFISKEGEFINDLHRLIILGYVRQNPDDGTLKLELSKLGRINNLNHTKKQFEEAISIATTNINDIERVKIFLNNDTRN